jgi:hypothetical protein
MPSGHTDEEVFHWAKNSRMLFIMVFYQLQKPPSRLEEKTGIVAVKGEMMMKL